MARYRNNKELIEVAKAAIGAGTQKEWARCFGISEAYVSDFLKGRRRAGPAILSALGYGTEPYYKEEE